MKFPDTEHPQALADAPDWHALLADSVTNPAELCRLLDLPPSLADQGRKAAEQFPLLVPRTILDRIAPGDPDHPLLRQFLPSGEELRRVPGFSKDPLGEASASQAPGVLSKYQGRSLIVTTGLCAVHCRFCFRRHHQNPLDGESFECVLDAARAAVANRQTTEVILSGGDPLILDDRRLARLVAQLAAADHLRRLRIHTRIPVVLPQRVTGELLAMVRASRLRVIFALHVNHPDEIGPDAARAIGALADTGAPLLSQTVLLRGVNDRIETLARLFETLVDLRVMPYYLHQLDRVAGAAHFEVPVATGARLVEQLRARLPGYAVPRYVRDIPNSPSKRPLP